MKKYIVILAILGVMLGIGCIDEEQVTIANATVDDMNVTQLDNTSMISNTTIDSTVATNDSIANDTTIQAMPTYEAHNITIGNIEPLGNGRTHIAGNWSIADTNGNIVEYTNNNSAVDPTYAQAIAFIKADKTDELRSDVAPSVTDVVIPLHDNAEKQGIKAGIVVTQTQYDTIDMCVAFNTTDKGIAYFSCVYENQDIGAQPHDVVVKIKLGTCTSYTDLTTKSVIPVMYNNKGFEVIGIDTLW